MVLAARENWTDPIPVKALETEYVDNLVSTPNGEQTQEQRAFSSNNGV